MLNATIIKEQYINRYSTLKSIASEIESQLCEILQGTPRIDRISARAKDIDKFMQKATRQNEDGSYKYNSPLSEIQDQIGARVIVFFKQDIEIVEKIILAEFTHIELSYRRHEHPDSFGYESEHLICRIPPETRMSFNAPTDFFELQICTLFQHAWAEANHDIGYKSTQVVNDSIKRQIAWVAAQSWGADKILSEIFDHINGHRD